MKTIQLKVRTIKCEGCVETIRNTLAKRSGADGGRAHGCQRPSG